MLKTSVLCLSVNPTYNQWPSDLQKCIPTYKCIYPTYKSVNPTYIDDHPTYKCVHQTATNAYISYLQKCKSELQSMTIRPTIMYIRPKKCLFSDQSVNPTYNHDHPTYKFLTLIIIYFWIRIVGTSSRIQIKTKYQ